MRILGISAFHSDAAAALLVDGQTVAAAQEERFSRISLDPSFPVQAIQFCLERAGIRAPDLDHVVFYEKPLRKFERILAAQMKAFPRSARSFAHVMFASLGDRIWIKNRITKELGVDAARVLFTDQQLALGANAFYTSPFDSAAVLTVDNEGEWATASIGAGHDTRFEVHAEVTFPHSLGLFASAITQFLGFIPGEDEHKVEALAGYGKPAFAEVMDHLVQGADGPFAIDQAPFRFSFDSQRLYDDSLCDHLGPARFSCDLLLIEGADTRHADIAASLQQVLEDRVLALARTAHERTPSPHLCFAGQLATNRRVNARVLADGPFTDLFIPASATKAGGALGAALFVHHAVEGGSRTDSSFDLNLSRTAAPGTSDLSDRLVAEMKQRLLGGEVIGWSRGEMEFGDQSTPNRCVMACPGAENANRRLLEAIQVFEPFLTCRVAVPEDLAAGFFELPSGDAPFLRLQLAARERLRDIAASAVTPDGTAWPHIVTSRRDPELHALLMTLDDPVLLMADFKLRGSPLVRTQADAVRAFERSRLDALVVDSRVVDSNGQAHDSVSPSGA